MPAPQRNQWIEAWEAAKERQAAARDALEQWWQAVKEEPALFWQTSAVRYSAYGLAALVVVLFVRAGIGLLQPGNSATVQPRATTANFDVLCSNPSCGAHFLIERKFRFRKFPVRCGHCNQMTGQRALRCSSATCAGRLVMSIEENREFRCVSCGAVLGRR